MSLSIAALAKTLLPMIIKKAFTKKNAASKSSAVAYGAGTASVVGFATEQDAIISLLLAIISTVSFFWQSKHPVEPTIEHGQDK